MISAERLRSLDCTSPPSVSQPVVRKRLWRSVLKMKCWGLASTCPAIFIGAQSMRGGRPSRHLISEVPVEAQVAVSPESQTCLGDLCVLVHSGHRGRLCF